MFSGDANIDWASLAQQWIQRNTKGAINETFEAPPPPNISQYYEKRARNCAGFDEKGEADMEMDDDELAPPPPMMSMMQPLQAGVGNVDITNQRPDLSAVWNTWMNPTSPAALSPQFPKSSPTAHIPSLMKINVPNPNDPTKLEENSSENTSTTIDAAKRKVLPAWIREGLEKMEREKQKQLEREQQMREHGSEKLVTATSASGKPAIDITVKDHVKSLESDDSSGNEQEDDVPPSYKLKNTNKAKYVGNVETTTAASSGVSNDDDYAAATPALFVGKSYEQRLADLMVAVRRTLTELLLEVTNDEIAQIAKETLNASKLKASSAQVIRKSALSSITNRLGLAAYSSSGDESDSDNSTPSDNATSTRDDHRRRGDTSTAGENSEDEIKAKLRVRRRAFVKTTEEIEECIAMNAAREEQKLCYYKQKEQLQKQANESDDGDRDNVMTTAATILTFRGNGKNNARDFGETTTESKLQQSNGKKSKERGSSRRGERTTRFSDNKDSKNVVAVTATYMSQINPTAAAITTVAPIPTGTLHGFHQISTSTSAGLMSDVNTNMHNLYTPTAAAAAGINSMLSAAEAALEKASKCKNATTSSSSSSRTKSNDTRDREIRRRRRREHSRRHSSDDTESSSTSNDDSTNSTSSSETSRDSKYSRASSTTSRHKHSSTHNSSRYHDRHEDQRRHYHKRYRDDYDDRSRSRQSSSSKHSTRTTHQRERSRDRSRSRSTYASSSSKRHQKKH